MQERPGLQNTLLWKEILRFALPIAATSMLQQLFNSADMAVVGQFASGWALAAVSGTSAVVTLFITVFSGLAVGANVMAARLIGARAEEQLPGAVRTALAAAILLGLLLTVLGELLVTPLLRVMATPESILAPARLYLRIYLAGSVFQLLYNFEAAILRANGDTRRPLVCLVVSGIVNVLLNLFFVVVCGWEVAGVAIATLLAGGVSAVMLLCCLLRERSAVRLMLDSLRLDRQAAGEILRIGIPAAVQGLLFNTANIIIQSGINVFGDDAISGASIGISAEAFVYYLMGGFAQASVTFNGRGRGAGQLSRCWAATRTCLILGGLVTELFAALLLLFRHGFAGLFTPNEAVAAYAALRMQAVLLFEICNLTIEVVSGALRGLGYSTVPTVLSAVFVCGVRIAWVLLVFPHFPTFRLLMAVYPISWSAAAAAVTAAYLIVKKRLMERDALPS